MSIGGLEFPDFRVNPVVYERLVGAVGTPKGSLQECRSEEAMGFTRCD